MKTLKYKKISPYPFTVRDISLYAPPDVREKDIIEIVKKEAGENLNNLSEPRLIDTFLSKSYRISFTFRLVFQAQDRTLTKKEINEIMKQISKGLINNLNCEVR